MDPVGVRKSDTCHSSLPLQPADAPRHTLPGRTDSPPDSGGGRRVRAGGGYEIQEGSAASRPGGYRTLIPNP
jgi:hypothetical protein